MYSVHVFWILGRYTQNHHHHLKLSSYTTCIHVEATNVCMWYIVVLVLGFTMVLGITTTTMYHMHAFVACTCMHVVYGGSFKFGDGFGYTYLSVTHRVTKYHSTL